MKHFNRLPFAALAVVLGILTIRADDFDLFCKNYGTLTTIAGKGDIGDGNQNGWQNSFEGKRASDAELSGPHMAMADSAGNIYIADKDAHAIRKVAPDGTITTLAGTNTAGDGDDGVATEQPLNGPNGLWVDKQGTCYILDLGNNKIRKVTADGMMTTVINDPAGISAGRGLWLSKGEDTVWYCSGSEIKRWIHDEGITIFATGFSGGLGNIVQDTAGNLIVTDRSANLVYRITPQGAKSIIAGNGTESGGGDGKAALETGLYGVRGVWVLPDNTYFLATHEGSQVWYVDAAGIVHLFLNGKEGDDYHSGDGENFRSDGFKVSEVRAVTVDYQGNVLVTENDRGFVRKIAFDSTSQSGIRRAVPVSRKAAITVTPLQRGLRCTVNRSIDAAPQLFTIAGKRVIAAAAPTGFRSGGEAGYVFAGVAEGCYFIRFVSQGTAYTIPCVVR